MIIAAWVLIGMRMRFTADDTYAETAESIAIHTNTNINTSSLMDSGLLWLVNQDHPLPQDFSPESLITHQGIRLHTAAHTAYNRMLVAMKADGIHGLILASAYRPYDYQQNLFTNKVNQLVSNGYTNHEAAEIAAKSLQRPGASEHQTGLALDVTISGDLTEAFGDTAAGKWIAANSHRFGFIIRYPQAKTDITHIIYEPWHLRYVGVPHAMIIFENNITLEEYAKFIADAGAYIVWEEPGRTYYLIVHSTYLPHNVPDGLVDISASHHGDGATYIVTLLRKYE